MSPNPEQRAQIIIGDDAETFLETELGKVVLGMAEQDEKNAMLDFHDGDPTDSKAMIKAQIDLKVARRFPQYLSELIVRGRETMQSLRQEE